MATTMPHGWKLTRAEQSRVHHRAAEFLNTVQSEIEDVYTCTPLQEALITLSTAGSTAYVKRIILSLPPEIDLTKFRSAVESVVESLAILRTRIVQFADLGFLQVVLKEKIQWPSESGTLAEFLEKSQNEVWKIGDPLLRYSMIMDSQEKSRWFVWRIHHAIYDGWSFSILADRVSKAYTGGQTDLTIGYKAFVQYLLDNENDKHGTYWRSSLEGNLCTQFPLLPNQSYMPHVNSKIKQDCCLVKKVQGITRTTMLNAAWAITIRQIQHVEDVIFGTILSGRNEPIPGIKSLIGPTVTTVPVRVKINVDDTIQNYLEKVQNEGEERKVFSHLGLHAISKLSGDARRACSFQTLFVVQLGEESHAITNDVGVWQRVEADIGRSSYALTIQCFLNKEETRIAAAFDSAVLEPWMARRLIQQLCFVVEQLMKPDRSRPVSDIIKSVSTTDIQEIWKWNAEVPAPTETCIHGIISDHARHYPLAPAICAWDGDLTYAQLDSLSTQLADQLVELGVKQEVLVPLCFEKSMWVPVAMLGVLKAGGAFVPLDTSQAVDRAKAILDEIKPVVAVVSKGNQQFIQQLGYPSLVPEESATAGQSNRRHFIPRTTPPHSAAYVIFTSGSTGTPKGVIIEHQAASTSLLAHGAKLGLCRASRFLQFASHSFDASIMEIFATLIYGGCVCVPSEESRLPGLTMNINDMEVNTLFLTPSVARLLQPDKLSSLTTLAIGGEAVSSSDIERWRKLPRLLDGYGPTECTILSVMQLLTANIPPFTIGKAVGSVAWVVDPNNHENLMPVGAIGELLIEGHILARGYLNDPSRTATSFINDPPWLLQGASGYPGRCGRLYKTGDLVQYDQEGRLVYIGRKDTQVKIRGQRIELGEVEYQIHKFLNRFNDAEIDTNHGKASASEIIVVAEVAIPRGRQRPRLVGFLCPGTSTIRDSHSRHSCALVVQTLVENLNEKLATVLPFYMIPSAYIPLEDVPVTANGKTDRRRLRHIAEETYWEHSVRNSQQGRIAPSNSIEEKLLFIWAEVLNIDSTSLSTDDTFTHLGGIR
ncbi:hypothetical protein N7462_008247 [Penicillium macrosclerotiorum]|uniref:uncharacterized protein n=1 Tax=Penicillium macrosclerotiorum TaxID=303699 RepID=UPI002548DAB7|nr:uncharacterized protein N7462_008247 [Penicillium macrosclerotiorum]KAJ5675350.1 hypothetical protein N7462_008247 [Penicillium macrosclerotiorum]